MMAVIQGWLFPHPPLIFPEVGRGKENEIRATVAAFREAAREIAGAAPDTIVIISPHARTYSDYFQISSGEGASGDMQAFGVSGVKVIAEFDADFIYELSLECTAGGFPAGTLGEDTGGLDHGASIPVRFIEEAFNEAVPGKQYSGPPKYVITGISGLPIADQYRFGQFIAKTAEKLGRKIIVIASGDLSHKLKDEGPYGFEPEGPEYDRIICGVAESGDFSRLLALEGAFLEKAGECGHRPLTCMAGALDRKTVEARLYSYEGPFGVGYCVASFTVTGEDDKRNFSDRFLDSEKERSADRAEKESPHVALARNTIESYIKSGRLYKKHEPLSEALTGEKAGVFVTIKKQGQLRGCIGTISPVTENVGEEIRANAVSAATRDPRFDAIGEDELPYLEYSVDVLAPPEPIESEDQLDPERYGVIVSLGGKRGLLLPNLDGIGDAETQVSIAMKKARISEAERASIKLERFEVIRHT
jgi:AmmeMemoRadiSam system protein A